MFSKAKKKKLKKVNATNSKSIYCQVNSFPIAIHGFLFYFLFYSLIYLPFLVYIISWYIYQLIWFSLVLTFCQCTYGKQCGSRSVCCNLPNPMTEEELAIEFRFRYRGNVTSNVPTVFTIPGDVKSMHSYPEVARDTLRIEGRIIAEVNQLRWFKINSQWDISQIGPSMRIIWYIVIKKWNRNSSKKKSYWYKISQLGCRFCLLFCLI